MKLNKVQHKLDRLTIEKSKEVDIPEPNFQDDEIRLRYLKRIYYKDKSFIWRMQEE